MTEEFLPFARPSISEEAINEVVACLKSGWITTGPRVAAFTEALKTYFDAPHVLPLTSATAGLHLALLGLSLEPGDEVITTPLTFAATLNTIVLAGGVPVLVDIDPNTLNMDMNLVESAITKRTRVILPVHFAGLPIDLDPLYDIATRYNLRVIEDAAHAMGTEYKGKRIGSFGDTQVFSFHPNKNMTTGEGGCVVTRDQELAEQIARLRFHGMDRQAWNRFAKSGSQDYEIVLPGYKYNMMDIQAAIGIHQLKELDGFITRRNELANRYQEALADWTQWTLPQRPAFDHLHSWHLYTPLINEEITHMDRSEFMQQMKERNIGTGLHYRAAHLYPYYRQAFGYKLGDFPRAEDVCDRIVSLPLFPGMSDTEHDKVLDVMYNLINGCCLNRKEGIRIMNILILGANGFIGSHLSETILAKTDWQIHAMDLTQDKLSDCLKHPNFHFSAGDITKHKDWISEHIRKCDVVLPLVAVATPAIYVQNPLFVFELDFEANLDIVRKCAEHGKRVIFPSTSEVYGMCPDKEFDEEKSHLVTGPINKERWIYSTSKQLLDRVIYAYGKHRNLAYTLFRPFNWYGPRLDNPFNTKPGGSRVLSQFIGNIIRGENINLVDGGAQQRCMTYIGDGIAALMRIIENKNNAASNKIFNIGNPNENISVRQLAELLKKFISSDYPKYAELAKQAQLVDVDAKTYYGEGYQDVSLRVPAIHQAREWLGWQPEVGFETGLKMTLDYYLK